MPFRHALVTLLGILSVALAAALTPIYPAIAQSNQAQPLKQVLPNDKRLLRWEYFHAPRAYPFDRVPAGAYQRAIADYARKFGALPGAVQAPSINVSGWTSIGPAPINTSPTTSGRISTIAVHPTDGNTIYLGAATGGVWKTTNGGTSWTALTDTQCSLAMGSVAIDPVNPNIVYAGTGEQHFSADSYYGCGVLRSTDGGSTWTQFGGSIFDTTTGGATISRLLIDPTTAGSTTTTKVFAATSFGLYRSTNSGTSWTQVLASTPVSDLVIDPSNANTLFAAVGNIFGGASNGVYKSTDGGVNWIKLGGGLPTSSVGRINIAVGVGAPGPLFAAVQNTANFALLGIWKSTDAGTSWTQITASGASCASQCWYDMHIYVSPADANTVFFGGLSLYRSTDGGVNFTDVGAANNVHVDHHGFAFQPGNANVAYAGSDGGIWKTADGGSSWTSINANLAITQFYAGFSLHPTDAVTAMGGTQDNGTLLTTGSVAWDLVIGGDGGYTAIDFIAPATKYGETQWIVGAGYIGPRRSDAGGPFNQKLNGITLSDRAQFIPPLVMSPTDSQMLYFGTFRVYRTTDRGENWSAISPDLTSGGTITAITQAKSSAQVIYAGTSDARVQVTTNGGTSWTLVTTGLPGRFVKSLAVHPTDANTAFVVVSGFGSGHVFKTTNGGALWTSISGNLPDVPVNSIVLDPGEPVNSIYIGTDLGVFRTADAGASWVPFNSGLPNTAVFDLVYNATTNVLVAATHGRGAYKGTPVATGPVLAVTPSTNFSSSGNQGGPFSPSSTTYTVQNSGIGTLNWTAAADQTWATVSPTSDSLGAGASATVTVSINSNADALAAGSYSSTLTFTNTNNGSGNTTRTANLTVNSMGGGPANDNFANATTLSGQSGSTTGTNVNATLQSGEPAAYAGTGTHTVWWKWTAPASGEVTFDTTGSSFDTVLTAYSGSVVNALTLVAGNDDIDFNGGNVQSRIVFQAQVGYTYYIRVDGYSPTDTGSITLAWSEPLTASSLVAAVLPYARSVQIGQAATAFGVIINAGAAATSCKPGVPAGFADPFVYQTTNTSNQLTGSPNTPIDIAAGATQNFVFGYTPGSALNSVEIGMVFDCSNTAPVVSVPGVNTFILSASSAPTPDIVAIGVTPSGDGIVNIPGNTGTGFFAAAGINIGASATITASADDGGKGLALALFICQTDLGGNCMAPPASSVTVSFANNASLTFTIFAQGTGNVPFDPAHNRLFLRFKDTGGVTRGATNVAVRTVPPGPATGTMAAQ